MKGDGQVVMFVDEREGGGCIAVVNVDLVFWEGSEGFTAHGWAGDGSRGYGTGSRAAGGGGGGGARGGRGVELFELFLGGTEFGTVEPWHVVSMAIPTIPVFSFG